MTEQFHDRRTAVAAAAEAPTGEAAFSEALGGPLGIVESGLPTLAFVTAYTALGQDASLAAVIAGAIGVLTTIARLARRQTLQYALSGLAGLGLAIFVVSRTGKAENFFLPGLLFNAGYAGAAVVSNLVRWPLLGVVMGLAMSQGTAWRADPSHVRLYRRGTWMWAGLFSLRLAVQLPLYLAGAVVALGVARIAMGVPLFAIGIWLTWLLMRRHV
jgi:hypothetical protein